jgi:hypothetical protein
LPIAESSQWPTVQPNHIRRRRPDTRVAFRGTYSSKQLMEKVKVSKEKKKQRMHKNKKKRMPYKCMMSICLIINI